MSNRRDNRIDEEQVCVDFFQDFLNKNGDHQCVGIEREQDDPPDFWATIDGVKFGVEVTAITVSDDQQYNHQCRVLKNDIKKRVQEEGIPGRYYLVAHDYPTLPKMSSREWRDLENKAVSIIRNARDEESTAEVVLAESAMGILSVWKSSTPGNNVGSLGPITCRWEGQYQPELHDLVQEAINKKRAKLANKRISPEYGGVILLLYDAYVFADAEDFRNVLLKTNGYKWFHSIFVVGMSTELPNGLSGGKPIVWGSCLYSRNPAWWKKPVLSH